MPYTEIDSRASAVARQTGTRWVAYGAIAVGLAYTLFPVWWMVSNSLKTRLDVFAMPPIWIVTNPSFVNYTHNFNEFRYAQYIFNSAVVALATTVFSVAVGAMAGYALARFSYPGRLKFHLSFWILSTRMIPPIVTIVPLFIFFHFVDLVNTKTSLIIAYTTFNLPFVVWMMRGYFQKIPREARRIGDGRWRYRVRGLLAPSRCRSPGPVLRRRRYFA